MSFEVVSHDEWLAARKELLDEEKAMTRRVKRCPTSSGVSSRW